jgi:hypothetical protein
MDEVDEVLIEALLEDEVGEVVIEALLDEIGDSSCDPGLYAASVVPASTRKS